MIFHDISMCKKDAPQGPKLCLGHRSWNSDTQQVQESRVNLDGTQISQSLNAKKDPIFWIQD